MLPKAVSGTTPNIQNKRSISNVPIDKAAVEFLIQAMQLSKIVVINNGATKQKAVKLRFAVQFFPPKYLNNFPLNNPEITNNKIIN